MSSGLHPARRRLPPEDSCALRDALEMQVARPEAATRAAAIAHTCAVARRHGLSAAELIMEVKVAWSTLPASRRASNLDAQAIVDRFVSGCIEEFYRG